MALGEVIIVTAVVHIRHAPLYRTTYPEARLELTAAEPAVRAFPAAQIYCHADKDHSRCRRHGENQERRFKETPSKHGVGSKRIRSNY